MFLPHTTNAFQNLLSKIQTNVKIQEGLGHMSDDELFDYVDKWEKHVTSGNPDNVDQAKANVQNGKAELSRRGFKNGQRESKVTEKDKVNKLDLKKAPKAKEEEVKPHEQDNPVDDEEHRCATDDMGMQNPDKMPKDKDREDVIVQIESKVKEGRFTRMASTDEQEQAIQRLETALQKLGKRFVGGTTIGKSPQSVVLDLKYQGSEVHVDSDGQVEINSQPLNMDYDDESLVEELKGLLGGERNHQTEEASVKSSGAQESKTNEAATGREPKGFVRFASAEEAFLWEDAILGQLSDGAWENATPHDHWEAWHSAGIQVGSPAGFYGFRPKRTSYGLNSLIEYVGDRMRMHLGLMRILKAKGVNPEEFVHNQLPNKVEALQMASKYAKQEGKDGYWSNSIQKWQSWGIDEAMMQKALKDTSEADLRQVLCGIQKTIKIQLPDAGPEKEPELKKEEPEVTKPEKADLSAPEKPKSEIPRGEPRAKTFPAFSKEGKIPSKPSEAGEEETTKALKEDEADYPPEKPATKMGPIISSNIKEDDETLMSIVDEIEASHEKWMSEMISDLVRKHIVDIRQYPEEFKRMLVGRTLGFMWHSIVSELEEGKAPISTDTAEQSKKKLMEDAPEGVDAEQLSMGIKIEMEHTDKPEEAKKIALDHLAEDPRYYTKLKKMEAGKCDDVQVEEALGPEEEQYKVSEEDLAVLNKAVKAGKLKNAYPSEEDMIDQLSSLEDIVDPATAEEGDVRLLWLKYVQIPKAYSLMGTTVKSKKNSSIPSADSLEQQWSSDPYPHKNEKKAKIKEGLCWWCGKRPTPEGSHFCNDECEATYEEHKDDVEESKLIPEAVVGPKFESEMLLKEVLAAMKKYEWNYEEAIKGFAAKNDMDPAELEQLLSRAIETESPSDHPVKEQEEVQYVSVADGILDKKTADDLAVKIKGTVATDDNDPKKFKVITRKDPGTV